jgi:pilus assembly protein CpaC
MNAAAATVFAGRALALVLAAAVTIAALALAGSAHRAVAGSIGDPAADGTRHISIGLNKSIVVRLPVAARDVLIGNPAVVEAVVRTQNTAYLFAKAVGQTNAFFFDAQGRQILSLDIDVSHDTKSLTDLIQRTIPGSRIMVDAVGENIVLKGVAANAAEARLAFDLAARFAGDEKKVLSTISMTGRDQVMLRVRVAELQREVLKQFGIDINELMIRAGKFSLSAATFNPFPLTGSGGGFLTQGAFLQGVYNSKNVNVDGVVQAMERDGLLRTLAEPTLTAISGESAKFLAGGEFPIITGVTCESGGVNCTRSVEFKPFGVGLGFTPVVLSEGRISLKVSTEVSELTQENAVSLGTGTIPSLKVRRAETTVELPSGGSMVLAGLIQEATKQQINGTPGLKDLPVLGALFRSRDFQSNQTELVVIVTPFVVTAVNEKQLTTPLDRFNGPTDRQTILFGRLNKVYGAAGDAPKGVIYHGNVGFIVE